MTGERRCVSTTWTRAPVHGVDALARDNVGLTARRSPTPLVPCHPAYNLSRPAFTMIP